MKVRVWWGESTPAEFQPTQPLLSAPFAPALVETFFAYVPVCHLSSSYPYASFQTILTLNGFQIYFEHS